MKTLRVKKEDLGPIDLSVFPSAGPNPSIGGMKEKYWGKDALCVKCGRYVYKVDEATYTRLGGIIK